MEDFSYNFTVVEWDFVKKRVAACNPRLAKAIGENNPGKEYPLIYANYPFGFPIIKNGNFFLPKEGRVISINIANNDLEKLLDYNWKSIPLGLVLEGAAESFWVNDKDSCIPKNILSAGTTCAKRTIFDESRYNFRSIWNLTSGASTLFLLPSIKDKECHNRLIKACSLREMVPKGFFDQFNLFSSLVQQNKENGWSTEFIFFTKSWLEAMCSGEFSGLCNYLRDSIWRGSEFTRNESVFDFVWHQFVEQAKRKGYKAKSYIYHFVKNIIKVALGEELGCYPANTNALAPIDTLTHLYMDVYRLKQQPMFLSAKRLDWSSDMDTVYLSLQVPIHFNISPVNRTSNSGLDDLSDIEKLLELFYVDIVTNKNPIAEDSRLIELPNKVRFSFYHRKRNSYLHLLPIEELPKNDINFKPIDGCDDKDFPFNSLFFNGLIKIDYKKKEG